MALQDVNTGTYYCWYYAAFGSLNKTVSYDTNDFGEGRTNTEYVMGKWEVEDWGTQDSGSYLDLWGVIKSEYNNGWFVPSKSEWSAFGNAFGITSGNYNDYNLSDIYWTSSQYDKEYAYTARFSKGYISNNFVTNNRYVRLSTTF